MSSAFSSALTHICCSRAHTDLDTCTCDLTANMCDAVARCSCDPDCSAADKALFAAAPAPTPASFLFNPPALPNVRSKCPNRCLSPYACSCIDVFLVNLRTTQATYCVSSDVATYNTRGDLSVSILNNLLCVSAVNSTRAHRFVFITCMINTNSFNCLLVSMRQTRRRRSFSMASRP